MLLSLLVAEWLLKPTGLQNQLGAAQPCSVVVQDLVCAGTEAQPILQQHGCSSWNSRVRSWQCQLLCPCSARVLGMDLTFHF